VLWGIQEQLSVDRQRRSYAQALSGAVVDFIGNRIQLLLAVPSQVDALGKVLADKAVQPSSTPDPDFTRFRSPDLHKIKHLQLMF
jgi:hypothetical protein